MRVAALAGGVGGAKLVYGLAKIMSPNDLTIIVNTGDDFEHLGLHICPDLDTVCYTLADLANPATGWGREGETWDAMNNLLRLGGPGWFNLGDKDLGTHLERTRRLALGDPLSRVVGDFCAAWGIAHQVLPMSDQPVSTWVETQNSGWLAFQEYFVRERCAPQVRSFEFRGAQQAFPALGVKEAISEADWVIVCPSNPWVSIDPILAVPGLLDLVRSKPVAAVSPIVGGKALKGPAAKMYQELGFEPSALTVANHYQTRFGPRPAENEIILFIDTVDQDQADQIRGLGVRPVVTGTIMQTNDDRVRLATEILNFCGLVSADRTAAL